MAEPFDVPLPTTGQKPWSLNPAIEEVRGRVGDVEDYVSGPGIQDAIAEAAAGIEVNDETVANLVSAPASETALAVDAKIEPVASDVDSLTTLTSTGRLSESGLLATIAEGVATEAPAVVPGAMFDTARDSGSLFALRQAAQIASSASSLIKVQTVATMSGSTTGNTSTWAQITGSTFSFIAPLSGRVLVRVRFGFSMPAGAASLNMRLHQANNEVVGTTRRIKYVPAGTAAGVQETGTFEVYLTGLVPGSTNTYTLAINNSDGTGLASVAGNATYGPVIFQVESLPSEPVSDTAVSIRTSKTTSLTKYAAALAAQAAGTRDAKILFCGDSTAAGLGMDGPSERLVGKLSARGIAAVRGGTTPRLSAGSNPRYTAGAGWPTGNLYGFGSQGWQYNNPSGLLTYADPAVLADGWDVYYLRGSGATNISLQVDSEVTQNFDSTGVTGIAKHTIMSGNGVSTDHALKIGATGSGAILFVEPFDSTSKKVRVANAGAPSTNSVTWYAGGQPTIYSRSMIQAYNPDLVLMLLGANDSIDPAGSASPTTPETFISNVMNLATAAPNADFVLISPIPSQVASEQALMRQYALRERYATQYGLVDLNLHFVDWATANANGWMSDVRHPNAAGMDQMATVIDAALAVA